MDYAEIDVLSNRTNIEGPNYEFEMNKRKTPSIDIRTHIWTMYLL